MRAPEGSPTVSYHYFAFTPDKIQGMTGGHGLGGAMATLKLMDSPSLKKFCTERLQGLHALCMQENTEIHCKLHI